ncbi:MAG: NACHT domain-containing protein, partial [Bacteroidota bacterium]
MEEMQLEFILSDNELYSQLQNGKIDFPTFDKEKLLLLKSERKKRKSNFDEVIALRNGYAHGATPSDTQCETDLKNFEPFLDQLLELQWLKKSALEVREGKVFVKTEKEAISLHPILLFRKENSDASFAFFNDLKNDKIGLLNYPLAKHYREKEFYDEFHKFLPLHEWKKTGNNEFFQRIEELTDTFKGRIQEREKLMRFVRDNHKGYFSVQGNPGIGKSALIAQFFKDLRAQEDMAYVQVVEYFIRRGTVQAQTEYMFNYLIRRTDELFAPGKEIRAEGRNVFDLQQQLFGKWRMWGEQRAGKKLLFLIDGLDEGTENNVVTYMPRENFDGVLIIYGSRPGGHKTVEDLWTQLPTEYHTILELAGLGPEDIRALIYEVANKYEVERESAWINAVQQRSQGNPLYLKLLCDALENGSIALNDIDAL